MEITCGNCCVRVCVCAAISQPSFECVQLAAQRPNYIHTHRMHVIFFLSENTLYRVSFISHNRRWQFQWSNSYKHNKEATKSSTMLIIGYKRCKHQLSHFSHRFHPSRNGFGCPKRFSSLSFSCFLFRKSQTYSKRHRFACNPIASA